MELTSVKPGDLVVIIYEGSPGRFREQVGWVKLNNGETISVSTNRKVGRFCGEDLDIIILSEVIDIEILGVWDEK